MKNKYEYTMWLIYLSGLVFGVVIGASLPQDKYSGSTQQQFDELAAKFMQLAQIEKADELIIKKLKSAVQKGRRP